MKLIIAGSRTFCCQILGHDSNPDMNCPGCSRKARWAWDIIKTYVRSPITEIVSGTARGADKIGELTAQIHAIPTKRFPAKWRVGGKVNMRAGFERNQEMADYADGAVLFWDGKSTGTLDMRRRMRKSGKSCAVYNFITGKKE
jgi:hypothetical protein